MKPTHEEVALCAYLIWEQEGYVHGCDIGHWLQAEKQLIADYEASQKLGKKQKQKNHEN